MSAAKLDTFFTGPFFGGRFFEQNYGTGAFYPGDYRGVDLRTYAQPLADVRRRRGRMQMFVTAEELIERVVARHPYSSVDELHEDLRAEFDLNYMEWNPAFLQIAAQHPVRRAWAERQSSRAAAQAREDWHARRARATGRR
jgi:hypothetical protein